MEQGTADRREKVRFKNKFDGVAFITTCLAASSLAVALLLAACGGGGSVLNHQSITQLAPQAGTCGQQPLAEQQLTKEPLAGQPVAMHPLPVIGGCSPPPQWDMIVANPGNNTVTSYQFTTTGNATPFGTLTSTNGPNGDFGLWYDGDQNFFVVNSNTAADSVLRYALSCAGPGSHSGCPDQTLSGTGNGINAPYAASENYVNAQYSDEIAYVINVPAAPATPSIVAHLENANNLNNPTPLYSIAGSNTQLADGKGLAVDSSTSSVTGAIYADAYTAQKVIWWLPSTQFPTPSPNQVLNIAPYHVISGSNTQITHPYGLFVDVNGYLYVANRSPDKILIFNPGSYGNVAPNKTITTNLLSPYGVAVYSDLTVYVTNDGSPNSITVYKNTGGESGSWSYSKSISGSNTGLNSPANLDVRILR